MNFKIVEFNRKYFLDLFKELTAEQLFSIPKGYNNNIIWNIGHILIVEQLLTYSLSGLDITVDKKFIKLYGKSSVPNKTVSLKEIEAIKTELIPAYKNTIIDYKQQKFKTYKKFTTGVGIKLHNIDDAVAFNPFHEGVHIGIIMAIKKLI